MTGLNDVTKYFSRYKLRMKFILGDDARRYIPSWQGRYGAAKEVVDHVTFVVTKNLNSRALLSFLFYSLKP